MFWTFPIQIAQGTSKLYAVAGKTKKGGTNRKARTPVDADWMSNLAVVY